MNDCHSPASNVFCILILINLCLFSFHPALSQPADLGSIGNPALSAAHLKAIHPEKADGLYWVDPDGPGGYDPFMAYFNQSADENGWTLVLLSNAGVAHCPRPYWNELTDESDLNLNGYLSSDITGFDMFMNVKYWNLVGDSARLDMGVSPGSLSHRAYYGFSLDEANSYALTMSNEYVAIHTTGTASSGMYSYHNGRPLSTRDSDHDAYTGNCSSNYYESAWWYGSCWSGSFWGGGGETFQDAPYWFGSADEYFEYGSIWLTETWIPVSDVAGLQNMRNDLSANYYLTGNIDASETSTWNSDGSDGYYGFEPLGNETSPFTGRFDGAGYSIRGLYINRPSEEGVGLFGYYDGTDIRSVVLQNICIEGGANYTGALAGVLKGGKISACNAEGVISVTGSYTGGITGYNEGGSLVNTYASVAVKGTANVGGLAGSNAGNIDQCYSAGPVSGSSDVGGLAGANTGTVSNSFWDIHTSGISSGPAGTGKTPAEMQDVDSYTDLGEEGLDAAWDFTGNPNDDSQGKNYWAIDMGINRGYPYLTIQKSAGQIIYVDRDATGDGSGTSWVNAYNTLQDALNDEGLWYGVNIWVAEGSYYPDEGSGYTENDRSASFIIPGGTCLYGGFEGTESSLEERAPGLHETLLSGDIGTADDPADNSYHVVKGGHNILLNGLVIEKGNAGGPTSPDMFGGGLYNAPGLQNILIEYCTFRDNNASSQGGAVYNDGYVTITTRHSVFCRNTASDNATVKNVNTEAHYYYCTFLENADASMGGALMYWGSGSGSPEIQNCTFIRNSSGSGGAIHCRAYGINAMVKNCIFYHNTPDDIALTNSAAASVSYSRIIQAPYAGSQNNIKDDPMFADTTCGNVALYDLSPCIDAGDEASPADPDGSRANMGDSHSVVPSPVYPSFSVTPGTASCGVVMQFDASSTTTQPGHEVSSYEWDFDYDGVFNTGATGEIIDHEYDRMNFTGSGESITVIPYRVALRVTDDDTPPFTIVKEGEAVLSFENNPPVADAGGDYYSTYAGDAYVPVVLDGSSSFEIDAPCDEITAYDWDTDGDGLYGADDSDGSPMLEGGADGTGENIEVVNASWTTGQNIPVSLIVTDYYGRKSLEAGTTIHIVDNDHFPADIHDVLVDPLNRDTLWFSFTVSHPRQNTDTFACSFSIDGTPVTVYDTSGNEMEEIPYAGYSTEQTCAAWFDSRDFPDMENAYRLKVTLEGDETAWVSSSRSGLFSIDNTPPSNPASCIEPGSADGVCTNNAEPVFTWSGAADNMPGILEYRVYWGTDISGESPDTLVSGNQYTPAPLAENGVYYLRINTLDAAGNEAGWNTLYSLVLVDYTYAESESICEGDSILWRGNYYRGKGSHYDSLVTAGGCDSIFRLDLAFLPTYSMQETHSMCEGEVYHWQGIDYTDGGDYTHAYTTTSGCDSIYYLHLTVLANSAGDTSATACENFGWYGIIYTASGNYPHTLTNAAGCDSILTLHLTIQTANVSVTVNGSVLSADAAEAGYQWLDCNDGYAEIAGQTDQTYSPGLSGDYAVRINDGVCIDTSACYPVDLTGLEAVYGQQIGVYPNPFHQTSVIVFNNPAGHSYDLYLMNLAGEVVRIVHDVRTSKYLLERGGLKEGIYFIELRGPKTYRGKILIR